MSKITYLPTVEEAEEGIGPWCVYVDTTPANLPEFERDLQARVTHYAELHRNMTALDALNGSIGNTSIPQPVSVNRGAW